jgi:hypothetical protein
MPSAISAPVVITNPNRWLVICLHPSILRPDRASRSDREVTFPAILIEQTARQSWNYRKLMKLNGFLIRRELFAGPGIM